MSPIFKISRLGTFSLKRVIVISNSSKCNPKTGLPETCVGDVFLYERWPSQGKKGTHVIIIYGLTLVSLYFGTSGK